LSTFSAEPEEGKIYGVQQGKALAKVLGVKRSEQFGMVALVCYEQGDYELVPTNVKNK
jgi:hypothetical protein